MAAGMTVAQADGRRRRREANRAAVIDALVTLFDEGRYEPGAAEIAARAGLSPRSLFRYFDDVDDLHQAAVERQLAEARPLLDVAADPGAPVATKVARLVEARVRLFEAVAPAARAARIGAHRHPVVAAQLAESRSYLRRQVRRLFSSELGDRPARLAAVDALCAFETFELLRYDQQLSRRAATAAIIDAVTLLVSDDARIDHG